MQIKTLVHWAGPRFDYEPGTVIEVTDEVGEARIEAGLAEKYSAKAEKPDVRQHAE